MKKKCADFPVNLVEKRKKCVKSVKCAHFWSARKAPKPRQIYIFVIWGFWTLNNYKNYKVLDENYKVVVTAITQ